MRFLGRSAAVLLQLGVVASGRLAAQCPDGSPPPCATSAPRRPTPADRTPSLTVLYLASASEDTTDAALADGITEELIVRLSQVNGLHVTSRYGALRYRRGGVLDPRQVGRELGVRYVLQGSLRRAGGRVRVSIEINDAAAGHNVWAATFDQPLVDVFALQDSVAVGVAAAVRGRLTLQDRASLAPRASAVVPEAYQAYLRGRAAIRARTGPAAVASIPEYRRAIALDPAYAPAHAALAQAYMIAMNWSWPLPNTPPESLSAYASRAVARALTLDSASAESWIALTMVTRELDPRRAVAAARRAIALDSANVEALHQAAFAFFAAGELDSAIAMERRATTRDPYYAFAYASLAQLLNVAGRPLEALATASQGMAIDSTNAPLYWHAADAYLRLVRPAEARAAAQRAAALGVTPAAMGALMALASLEEGDTAACRTALAAIATELREELARTPEGLTHLRAGLLAGAYAQLSEADSALAWARRVSPTQRRFYRIVFARHWVWEPLRNDPRFQALLEESRR